ncbi:MULTISPECIES: bifunctional DNA-formamidopyrimidine glycosylase/DNA-(apurinic or apyrimidinic site) lyase [Actinomycetes]|uniref:Formamidopyrimidine-DNA glycosylase n=2 Tax=Micrococcales TaxID=85006 RepID=A0A1H1W9Z3_BRESA|nr:MULTISPECIES: bifunctional DNA-formamidopyrimidine glycosylase/DNA-(apurinic or apyrimidinic site) lyase [Actinomycetes]MBP2407904.1 formamidopyrimidine-DNA glycosylase [Brachybacterium fresconis]MCG7308508.1 bifunctional DNA-formamidopyrimidine glycosylase/DNA-(apurinic or apyrimidinic site) lyase [Brachybacterium sp. ACRRE]MDN5544317.1 bifunctional DNA-formamidopyrimidine glycosylase/DNA-(apurinic or apyrimidinic site) lyase [Rhodococcus sp. (in: high G+C Gram-positive bacteria)]SDS93491.1
MPELPEVEVVRRGIDDHVRGRTIASATVLHPRAARRHVGGPADLAARMVGATITGTARRGKYLWLILDGADALLMHLGMSGQMLISSPDAAVAAHERARFTFTDGGHDLRFDDQRTFGHLLYDEGGAVLPSLIAHIARDPFDPQFDQPAAVARIKARSTGIKRVLLDQTVVSGIGNIYADEALWAAKEQGETAASSLSKPRISALVDAAREVMAAALAQGGTSFDSLYVDVAGSSGYFARSLNAYGLAGQPCMRCGTSIVREKFMNRSSFFCPVCQRKR